MNNQQAYRRLISGQTTGLTAACLRFFLTAGSIVYTAVIRFRNFLYCSGWLRIHTASVPVISIGNITTGGTGKTPLVIWLYKFLQQKNVNCAILTRGYKAIQNSKLKTQNYIDEPAILTESCPNAKVIVNPDRVAGADVAINKFNADVLILDDGFQHRRLARNIDIVTIDSTRPFGYGKVLPAGLLREPLRSLDRADAVVLTRCAQTSEAELTKLEDKLRLINPNIIIARSIHAPICAKIKNGEEISIDKLKDKKIFAFCGIGNPDAFLNTIKKIKANLISSKVYNDHHRYTGADITYICENARNLQADCILTTQKDWTKISSLTLPQIDIPFAYLTIELKLTADEGRLKQLIEDALAGKIS